MQHIGGFEHSAGFKLTNESEAQLKHPFALKAMPLCLFLLFSFTLEAFF